MAVLALIPARGGSKGVPRKNLRDLAGKPLIGWMIEAAIACPLLDRVVVSTDHEEIATIARQCGAEVPCLRPPELARDETPTIPSILHSVEWLEKYERYSPDFVMCLQPTSPLCTTEDITGVVHLVNEKKAKAVVSVTVSEFHPYFTKKVDDLGRMTDFIPLDEPVLRRQDLPLVYSLNGAMYIAQREVLENEGTWFTNDTYTYVMPPERSLDINIPWDFYLADLVLRDQQASQAEALVSPVECGVG